MPKGAKLELVKTDELSQALLVSLKEHFVVLDQHGVIVAVNEAWRNLVRTTWRSSPRIGPKVSYLDVHKRAAPPGDETAAKLIAGIESVLEGSRDELTIEYACPFSIEPRWFSMSVVSLKPPHGGAILSYADITARKKAEAESRRVQEELTHAVRLSMMGELMASLAHELNQPLAAIRSNAQAALHFLASPTPDLAEVRAALTEIVEDDRWAAEVIWRLRMLARRESAERTYLDLNDLLRTTLGMIRNEAITKKVSVKLDLAPGLATVLGDPVQLQQVVLNLVLNAFEAMVQELEGPRELGILTSLDDQGIVTVSVRDTGTGVKEEDLQRIFEAFYTNKPDGMGMGLSISQSILEAHGGQLWGVRNPDRGMTFHFSLPAATR